MSLGISKSVGAVGRLVVEVEASNDGAVDEYAAATTDSVVERGDSGAALKEEEENLMTGKPRSRVSWTTPIEASKESTDGAAVPVINFKKTRRLKNINDKTIIRDPSTQNP
ncbi:hypothetical protein H4R99_002203 [Coemansia sp. RSA 1722]|nr:hypothetical protein H4R99_002203 [Coemansia sp. RSA 1722]